MLFATSEPAPAATPAPAETKPDWLGPGQTANVAYSPDGKSLAISGLSGVHLYDTGTLEEQRFLDTGTFVRSLAFSSDGRWLALVSDESPVSVWNMAEGEVAWTLEQNVPRFSSLAFSADGSLLVSSSWGETVTAFDMSSGEATRTVNVVNGAHFMTDSAGLSPDGRWLAWRGESLVAVWDLASGEYGWLLDEHSDIVSSLAFSADGKRLATGSWDREVIIWSLADGKALFKLGGQAGRITSLAFSADGSLLAVGAEDGTVVLWDVRNGEAVRTFSGQMNSVAGLGFSPDGKVLALVAQDGLWSLGNNESGDVQPVGRIPFSTPRPTSTPTPVIQPPVAQCPNSTVKAPQMVFSENLEDYQPQILAYLTTCGSVEGLQRALTGLVNIELQPVEAQVLSQDVTGDNLPDVIVNLEPSAYMDGLYIFIATAEKYEPAFMRASASLHTIIDMNNDGLPEIVSMYEDCGAGCVEGFEIYAWNGEALASQFASFTGQVPEIYNGGGGIIDVDGDGILELVLSGGWSPRYGLGRTQHDIWAWDGQAFIFIRTEYDPPEYRIYAIHDGDHASRAGEYAQALAAYQQAIFDEKLLGWSWDFIQGNRIYQHPVEGPEEQPRLSAYARYRIMLLHVAQGNLNEARIVYNTLQNKFPEGAVGRQYAELATIFWDAYQSSQDTQTACGKAIEYAAAHSEEVLFWLGNFYGDNNPSYQPEDICPFSR